MPWDRLQENWKLLTERLRSRRRAPAGAADAPPPARARRVAWVEQIQRLARSEARQERTSSGRKP
jgi:hypothetical protein